MLIVLADGPHPSIDSRAPTSSDSGVIGAVLRKLRAQAEVIRQLRREARERDEALAIAHAEIERLTPP